jgi:prolyl 4-hydroxylase
LIDILDTSWQIWIKDNIERGCTKSDMLNTMIKAGVSEDTALVNLALGVSSEQPITAVETALGKLLHQKSIQKKQQEGSYLFQHENSLQTHDGQVMHIAMRCDAPDIVLLDHFMTESECDMLCELSKGSLTKSTVVDDKTGDGVKHEARTSQGTYFTLGQNALVEKIEARISEITGIPTINGEGIQILNYANGGEYKPHYDYFPDSEGGRNNMVKGGQRIITIIMYLNDVAAGGATIFPEINLSIFPKKGSALYFSYCNSSGDVDPLTLHGGSPVIKGEKWIATKWLRQNAYL